MKADEGVAHRSNMELDLEIYLGSYTRALLVSHDRRHLFVTRCDIRRTQLSLVKKIKTSSHFSPLQIGNEKNFLG